MVYFLLLFHIKLCYLCNQADLHTAFVTCFIYIYYVIFTSVSSAFSANLGSSPATVGRKNGALLGTFGGCFGLFLICGYKNRAYRVVNINHKPNPCHCKTGADYTIGSQDNSEFKGQYERFTCNFCLDSMIDKTFVHNLMSW